MFGKLRRTLSLRTASPAPSQPVSSYQRVDPELCLRTPRTKLRVVSRSVAFDQDALAFDHLQDYISDLPHDDPGAVEFALRTQPKPLMLVVRNEEFDADPQAFQQIHKYVPALTQISEQAEIDYASGYSDAVEAQTHFEGFGGDQTADNLSDQIASDEHTAEFAPCMRTNSMPVEVIDYQEFPHAVLAGQSYTVKTKSPLLGGWSRV